MVKFGYDNIRYNKEQVVKRSERYIDPHVQLKDEDIKGNLDFYHGYPVFGLVEFRGTFILIVLLCIQADNYHHYN